jgi:flagellar protein FlaG
MSMNSPISNNGGSYERVQPVDNAAKSAPKSADVPTPINNSHQLKEAELKGENYSISDEQVVKAIERAIKAMEGKSTSLEFSVHEKTRQIAVKVLDKNTGEVIREIPPEKQLDFVAKLWEMAGILIDERR